jgi:SAM-dependent methyltransferase
MKKVLFKYYKFFSDLLFDKRFHLKTRIDFGDEAVPQTLLTNEYSPYHPSPWRIAYKILKYAKLKEDDVIVDFGSGKGRMLYLFGTHKVRKIYGVEISESLSKDAIININFNLDKLKCKDYEFITSDASKFSIPDDMTLAFFFNPFKYEIFQNVINNIFESYKNHPRRIRIIYFIPVMSDIFDKCPWLIQTHNISRYNIKIYETKS